MLRRLVTASFRHLSRHRGFVAVSVIGLALALAVVTTLLLFVEHEWSYDRFHEHVDRIYKVVEHEKNPEGERIVDDTRMPVLPAIVDEMPEVVDGTRFRTLSRWLRAGDTPVETSIAMVDSSFFDVFSFAVVAGDARAAVRSPNRIALTALTARTLFGDADPIGQTLDGSFGQEEYVVTAVLADPPPTSTLQFEAVAARSNVADWLDRIGSWYNTNTAVFIRLTDGADPAVLDEKLVGFSRSRFEEYAGGVRTAMLRPMTEIHAAATASSFLIKLLFGAAIAILLVASINVTNLKTARGLDRVAEVGMRRALGARPRDLAMQFMGESILTTLGALGLALGLVAASLPTLNRILELNLALQAEHVPIVLGGSIVLGIVVGIYPALRLLRLRPSDTLRGQAVLTSGQRLRTILVVVQIAVSAVLILGAITVESQIRHMKAQHTEGPADRVVVAELSTDPFADTDEAEARLRTMRTRIEDSPTVESTTLTNSVPARYERNYNTYMLEGDDGASIRFRFSIVGDHYFETHGMERLRGEPFRASSDAEVGIDAGVIVNETAARQIEAATGKSAIGQMLAPGGTGTPVRVRAVVEDVRVQSAGEALNPIIHYYFGDDPTEYRYLAVRLASGQIQAGMDDLRAAWTSVYTAYPFNPFFLDDAFDDLYETQERVGFLAAVAAALAILIACLGLFSLAAFTVRQRRREISVRKVLGATATSVVGLLSKDVLRLVTMGLFVAIPIAYLGLQEWLASFATKTTLGPSLFLGTAAGVAGVAWLAVSYHALRAARIDPARTLRSE